MESGKHKMSIFYCNACGRTKDSDYEDYENIDGYDICESCVEDFYEYCEECDSYFDPKIHKACPSKYHTDLYIGEDDDE